MPKRGGLGRGLDALIPNKKQKSTSSPGTTEEPAKKTAAGKSTGSKNSKSVKQAAGKGTGRSSAGSKTSASKPAADKADSKRKKAAASGDISEEARKMADAIISGKSTDEADNELQAAEADIEVIEAVEAVETEEDASESATVDEISADNESPDEEDSDNEEISASEAEISEETGSEGEEEASSDSYFEVSESPDESISENGAAGSTASADDSENLSDKGIVQMKISMVEPNRAQPRKYFDEDAIEELADSIRQFGIISPLLVQKKDNYYEIIAGERRWRAAKKAGLKYVPVIVREFSSQEAVEVSLIENIQREDLNPIEEARAYERLTIEYGLAQEEVAGRVSKSRSAVANSMRLLKLSAEVQKMVETGELSEGHARTIIPITAPDMQNAVAEQIIKERLTVRQTEKLVKDLLRPGKKPVRMRDEKRNALLNSLSENLKAALGTKVMIHQSGKNKGKIEIEYYSDAELDRLYELLRSVR